MKTGRSLVELVKEIERQYKTKKDYVVASRVMDMDVVGRTVRMLFGGMAFGFTKLAHHQIAQKLDIPTRYYDKMLQQNQKLLSQNVNTGLHNKGEHRLMRTLDGDMRAFLSKRYRPLDNYDLVEAVLPLLNGMQAKVLSCEITENKFYLKAVTERITDEVTKGDIVQSGICISNSEVGLGRLSVEPLVYRLSCLNGMIINDYGIRKNHVGRRSVDSRDVTEFYRDETKKQDDKAFWMKVQDTVRATLDEVKFKTIVDTLREATTHQITGDVVSVISNTGNKFDLAENEQKSILSHLIQFGSLTQYSLANAVTQAAQDVESYDRSTELEHIGSNVISLSQQEWSGING